MVLRDFTVEILLDFVFGYKSKKCILMSKVIEDSEFKQKFIDDRYILVRYKDCLFDIKWDIYVNCFNHCSLKSYKYFVNTKRFKDGHSYFLYDKEEKEYVGMFDLQKVLNTYCLTNFSIISCKQSNGLGKMLMRYFFDVCKDNNISKVYLFVKSVNVPALSLYNKFGFIQI